MTKIKFSPIRFFFMATIFFCIGSGAAFGSAMKLEVGSEAPDFTLKEFRTGESKSLKDYLGKKIVMLEFWATWCNICKSEMPQIQKQYEEYKSKGFELLAITLSRGDERDREKIGDLIEKMKLTYPVLMDTEFEVATKHYGLSGPIPLKVIIDCSGKIRYAHVGGFADGISEVPFVLDQLLSESSCGDSLIESMSGDAGGGKAGLFDGYVGSDRCGECHEEIVRTWKETLHAEVVRSSKDDPSVVLGDFSVPGLGFSLEDVEYVIGGHWDQRYLKKIGDDYFVLPKLWSVSSKKWRDYNVWSWRKKPYKKYCKGCHVTAYNPEEDAQSEMRVGCEACHGPGKSHVDAAGIGNIVNPKSLEKDKEVMICAACHVRGRDLTGEYYFPVGFLPGEDLGEYYEPLDKAEGESNTQAILRGIEEWKKKKSANAPPQCNVCGIKPPSSHDASGNNGKGSDFCFGCHDFKERYAEHTKHPDSASLECGQCHVQSKKETMNPGNMDIHTYGYFLIHTDSCYDPLIENNCENCHKDKDIAWARRIVEQWRGNEPLDH